MREETSNRLMGHQPSQSPPCPFPTPPSMPEQARSLGKDLVDYSERIGRLHLQLCRTLAVFESKHGHELDGHQTAKGWLAHHTGMTKPAAGQLVKIARRLRDLPALAAAAEDGAL